MAVTYLEAIRGLGRYGFDPVARDPSAKLLQTKLGAEELLLLYERLEFQRKYSPNQPRVPAGHPDGGQWTRVGGGGLPRSDEPRPHLEDRPARDVGPGLGPEDGLQTVQARIRLAANADSDAPLPSSSQQTSASPGKSVVLPDGSRIPDPTSPTGYLMSPVADLAPIAAAGRQTGEKYLSMLENPASSGTAIVYLLSKLDEDLGQGGTFDYQRHGNWFTGYTQLRQFKNVSNFNVGLYCQQAGLTLDGTLIFAGMYARVFSRSHRLDTVNVEFITAGFKAGESGMFGIPATR